MNYILYILIGLLVGALGAVIFFRRGSSSKDDEGIRVLQGQLESMTRLMDERLAVSARDMQKSLNSQFDISQKLISDVKEKVSSSLIDVAREQTRTNEATRQFVTIAEQLSSLEKTLKHQKQRGNLGEASLSLILSNTLDPTTYSLQHMFKNSDKVDAIIKTKEGFIPIDAKYSLDNYHRLIHEDDEARKEELAKLFRNDLKKRIDETAKYIRPEEGTLPFAFMFIPAEAIYYDLLVNEATPSTKVNARSLVDYAYNEKHVVIVSPTTFVAYLQSVLYGFKAYKIEESAKDIRANVEKLQKHLEKYEDYHKRLGNTLGTAVNHYEASSKELGKVDKDVMRITGIAPGLTSEVIEGPQTES